MNKTQLTERPKFTQWPEGSFPAELEDLINRHCLEGGSNTPDFILAEYMMACLENFNICVNRREQWYGREDELDKAHFGKSR